MSLLGAALLAATVVAGCGSDRGRDSGQSPPSAGVRATEVTGVVLTSPTCPVARAGRPCPARPLAGASVSLLRDGALVARTRTDRAGRFRLACPPGAVVLVAGRTPGTTQGGYVGRVSRAVDVKPATTTEVRLVVDTGIR